MGGQKTSAIEVGLSTLADIGESLEKLSVYPPMGHQLNGDKKNVEFLTEQGNLDLMKSSPRP